MGFRSHNGFCGWYNANRDVGGTEEMRNAAGPGQTAARVLFVMRYAAVTVYSTLVPGARVPVDGTGGDVMHVRNR